MYALSGSRLTCKMRGISHRCECVPTRFANEFEVIIRSHSAYERLTEWNTFRESHKKNVPKQKKVRSGLERMVDAVRFGTRTMIFAFQQAEMTNGIVHQGGCDFN